MVAPLISRSVSRLIRALASAHREERSVPQAGLFDAEWYCVMYPDACTVSGDPLQHYVERGWKEGRKPNAWFDPAYYLSANPDVKSSGMEPLLHFLTCGAAEGRLPGPSRRQTARSKGARVQAKIPEVRSQGDDVRLQEEASLVGGHFDTSFYLAAYPDIAKAGVDPVVHFLTFGWKERRNPSREFDVEYYLASNPDVEAAGVNPFVHYLRTGKREGRRATRACREWRRRLDQAVPPRERLSRRATPAQLVERPLADLQKALKDRREAQALVVSISHDDYVRTAGGIQNVIGDEELAFRDMSRSYLHAFPTTPLPILADTTEPSEFLISLRLDREFLGVFRFSDLLTVLGEIRAGGVPIQPIIHHLMGHSPELVLALLRAAESARPVVWIHDFFTLCPSYALLRNDIAFCGAPRVVSAGCALCCYGEERKGHVARMSAFFDKARPAVLAPSKAALDLWMSQGRYPCSSAAVAPLGRLITEPAGRLGRASSSEHPLRVAHIGSRSFTKGWAVFEELALRFKDDPRYLFFQLGTADRPPLPGAIRHIEVEVSPEDRLAMIEALAEARIDVVVNWSLAFETFSFTTLEALAAGAFVVARTEAGNVWPLVQEHAPDQGCCVSTESDLVALFEDGSLRSRVEATRIRWGTILPTGGAASLAACRE